MFKRTFFILVILLTAGAARGQSPPTAYINAHILPVSGPAITRGTILVVDGKIKALGARVALPAGCKTVDLHGDTVIPGLVDASSSLFVTPDTISGAGAADQNVVDGLDPFDKSAAKVLARGVTTVYVSPGSRGGMGAVVKLQSAAIGARTGAPTLETVLKPKAGVHLAIGVSSGGRSTSLERIASYQSLRTMFTGAQQYMKQQQRAALAKTSAAAPPAPADPQSLDAASADDGAADGDTVPGQRRQFGRGQRPGGQGPAAAPRAQPVEEVLSAALKGDIPVRIEAHRVDDILNALRLQEEFKFKLVLEAPTEAGGIAREIARHNASVIWNPIRPEGAPQLETQRYDPAAIAALEKAGVRIALSARSSAGSATRFLLEDAGAAIGAGLNREDALRAVTLSAAEILGVADRIGSLQPGKDADMAVISGQLWEPNATVKRVIVNGVQVYGGEWGSDEPIR